MSELYVLVGIRFFYYGDQRDRIVSLRVSETDFPAWPDMLSLTGAPTRILIFWPAERKCLWFFIYFLVCSRDVYSSGPVKH